MRDLLPIAGKLGAILKDRHETIAIKPSRRDRHPKFESAVMIDTPPLGVLRLSRFF